MFLPLFQISDLPSLRQLFTIFQILALLSLPSRGETIRVPRFVGPVNNVTVTVGREAVITCTVDNLGTYKVAWVRVDTQTILAIHNQIITRSHRVSLSHTDSWTWNLLIKNVREADRGWYMAQINTDPMMSQNGYLQVVVPPDIADPTSPDMVVREGANVALQCTATGFPLPKITWKREDHGKITIDDHLIDFKEGPYLNFTKVNRLHMGFYLCIASNLVPPTVSRRISLIVHFSPMITIAHQLVGAALGQDVILECHSEAFPKSINYWRRDNGETIVHGSKDSAVEGEKYEPILLDNVYRVTMRLTIRGVSPEDYGSYICLSKNSLGETDGLIKVYPITLAPSVQAAKTTTFPASATNQTYVERGSSRRLQFGLGSTSATKGSNSSTKLNSRRDFGDTMSVGGNTGNNDGVLSQETSSKLRLNSIQQYYLPTLLFQTWWYTY